MTICRLCTQERELKGSHITPKLFFKQMKRTSPTERFRNNVNPNRPEQDGEKHPFLCHDCEEKFSNFETSFNNKIYRSLTAVRGVYDFDTDDDTKYFALSVAWRNLKVLRERGITDLTEKEYEKIDETLEQWRVALYSKDFKSISAIKQYIIPTAKLRYFSKFPRRVYDCVCPDFHPYYEEDSFKQAFVTVQVPYLIFVSMLWGELPQMTSYEVGNHIKVEDIQLPETLKWQLDHFHVVSFQKTDKAISDEQRANIMNRVAESIKKGHIY